MWGRAAKHELLHSAVLIRAHAADGNRALTAPEQGRRKLPSLVADVQENADKKSIPLN